MIIHVPCHFPDNTVKNELNLPISNQKLDLHYINAHTKFGENPLIVAKVTIWKQKCKRPARQTDKWMANMKP